MPDATASTWPHLAPLRLPHDRSIASQCQLFQLLGRTPWRTPRSCGKPVHHIKLVRHNNGDRASAPTQRDPDARCKGVLRLSSSAVMSTPRSINNRTISGVPKDEARCKGVEELLSFAVTSAPCSTNNRTISTISLDIGELKSSRRSSPQSIYTFT